MKTQVMLIEAKVSPLFPRSPIGKLYLAILVQALRDVDLANKCVPNKSDKQYKASMRKYNNGMVLAYDSSIWLEGDMSPLEQFGIDADYIRLVAKKIGFSLRVALNQEQATIYKQEYAKLFGDEACKMKR